MRWRTCVVHRVLIDYIICLNKDYNRFLILSNSVDKSIICDLLIYSQEQVIYKFEFINSLVGELEAAILRK